MLYCPARCPDKNFTRSKIAAGNSPGDGDNSIFVDFTQGNDVIGHELTHGVTQHSLQLDYSDDAGGLNESMSDCFGSMFRQWQANQDAGNADWLIGSDIMGPTARDRG